MDLQEVAGGCEDWMELAQDRDRYLFLFLYYSHFKYKLKLKLKGNSGANGLILCHGDGKKLWTNKVTF